MKSYDVVIIGGGVIGCSIARSLSLRYSGKFAIVEKENFLAAHASGRNSGVVHSGFYYQPDSLKARFSVEGSRRLIAYCKTAEIPLKTVGTLVVGHSKADHSVLKELERRGKRNGVEGISIVDRTELNRLEPYASGDEALHSPIGSIIDAKALVAGFSHDCTKSGVDILLACRVLGVEESSDGVLIKTNLGWIRTRFVINSAGLQADRIAKGMGIGEEYSIVPFRGEYYVLNQEKSHLVRSMIYPTPNLELPFLGIHLTKTIGGRVIVGPNAVLAPGREAYRNADANFRDVFEMLSFRGFWVMSLHHARSGVEEIYRSLSKQAFTEKARRLIPVLTERDFTKSTPGIRAQLVNRHGQLVDDLVVERTERSLHILNAVSPGMTCALPFADYLTGIAENSFDLQPRSKS